MRPRVPMLGRRFGRPTVTAIAKRGEHTTWICECICGKTIAVRADSLRDGRSKSCGCAPRNQHDGRGTPEYVTWRGMLQRCQNPNATGYARYGGRGISVCERWQISFVDFLSDMGPRPSLSHSLDRIDPNGNYEPTNCRWATRTEQANNRRDNRPLTIDGVTKCAADWAREFGVFPSTVCRWLDRGMSMTEIRLRYLHKATAATKSAPLSMAKRSQKKMTT